MALCEVLDQDTAKPRAYVAWLRGRYEMAFDLNALTAEEFTTLMENLGKIRIIPDQPLTI